MWDRWYRIQHSTEEYEQHDHQDFEWFPFGGHHMLEKHKQSVNIAKAMGGPNSI